MDNQGVQPTTTNRTLRPISIIITGIILLAIVGGGVYLVVNHRNKTNKSNSTKTAQQTNTNTQTKSNNNQIQVPTSAPSTNNQDQASSAGNNSSTQALTNTGPGSTVAIFVGTVILVSTLHNLYFRYKTKSFNN